MTIGINATAISKQPRTGVEEYVYQLVRHLAGLQESEGHRFLLYSQDLRGLNFFLPQNFNIRQLKWRWPMWTQIRLTGELFLRQPDVLFIPAHILPFIHPKKSVVAIQGLEYERFPELYPKRHLSYLRFATKYAAKRAAKILVPSESTKNDLVQIYSIKPERVTVIRYGVELQITNYKLQIPNKIQISNSKISTPYILYIGRIESKKNLINLVKAFDSFKERYHLPHKLVLAGAPGFGCEKIRFQVLGSKFQDDIEELGYIDEEEKWQLLQNADLFVFVSWYEGFGFPILEAQAMGCPVVCSDVSSMPEVAGEGAVLVGPDDIEQIAKSMYKVIEQTEFRQDLINKGYENIKKFSWPDCARETLEILTK